MARAPVRRALGGRGSCRAHMEAPTLRALPTAILIVALSAPAAEAFRISPSSGPPHVARPYRGPKPTQEGLQLEAKPHVWPVRVAQFLGWALVP
jgi:hypothetical protein